MIDSTCKQESDIRHRHERHLATVSMIYIANHFGEDAEELKGLVAGAEFSRIRVRLLGWQGQTSRRSRTKALDMAFRHVRQYLHQAPVKTKVKTGRPKPPHLNDGGRLQRAKRGVLVPMR